MKRLNTALLVFIFSVLLTTYAFADTVSPVFIVGYVGVLAAIGIAVVIMAVAVIIKAIRRKR